MDEVERLLSILEVKPSQDINEPAPSGVVPTQNSEDTPMTSGDINLVDHDQLQCYD